MLVKFSVEKENKSKSEEEKGGVEKENESKSEEEKSNSNQKVKIARKNFPDNIIQKAKNKTIKYLFIYSQIYFNRYKLNIKKDIKLQKIEYKGFNDDLNKDINLQMLNTPLSTILSYTNRSKCKSNINPENNKKLIAEILEKEAKNEIITKFLNMTFKDWSDIFTRKKKIEHDIEFEGLRLALEEIMKKNEDDYLTRFVFYLYNYNRWFQNKKGRKKRK